MQKNKKSNAKERDDDYNYRNAQWPMPTEKY